MSNAKRPGMHFFPFLILGLLNGIMVGVIAGLIARGIAPGDDALRFRDTAMLGMLGSLVGGVIATMLNANDGYLVGGPSSLFYSFGGAGLAIFGFTASQQSH